MKILVLNSGSSSVKYQVFIIDKTERLLAKGLVDRIGLKDSTVTHSVPGRDQLELSMTVPDHRVAIREVLNLLTHREYGVIRELSEIEGVGHRVVHGGEKFSESVLINDAVLATIRECCEIAPLHNPPNLLGIEACKEHLPGARQVAVFDTAFHQTMPPKAYAYGIPYQMYKEYAIRRYGFHGTSHQYVSRRAAQFLKRPLEEQKLISCHLGNGASMAAIKDGVSVDTSMGFTPLEGLLMGTRSGDLDPAIILHIMAREELSLHEANTLLNKHSGLSGISGVSSDMREIIEATKDNPNARVALEIYCYRIKKYIGSYAAAMGGLDTLVFTAGVGENAAIVREKSCEGLEFLGVRLDPDKNNKVAGKETDISTDDSAVKVLVIPTNEELVIARDTERLLQPHPKTEPVAAK